MREYESRGERRKLSNVVTRTVDYQSSPPQPDRVAEHTILTVLSTHADYDANRVRDALETAVADGRLESDGERYWIPEKVES